MSTEPNHRASLANPYTVGSPADKYFFNREELLAEMEANLVFSSCTRQNYAVVGPRQIGKTSLVLQLRDRLYKKAPVSYLTLQTIESRDQATLYTELLKPIRSQLHDVGLDDLVSEWWTFAPTKEHSAAYRFARDLEELQTAISKSSSIPRVVFIIDEAELLQDFGGPSFLGFLRSLMQNYDRLAFVVVGSPLLSRMVQDYTSPFYNVFLPRSVGPLPANAAQELVIRPATDEWALTFTEEATQSVLRRSGNHPHLIRLLCYEICEHVRTRPEITVVDGQIVERASERLIGAWIPNLESGDYFSGIWETQPLSQLVMLILAWSSGPMRLSEIREEARKQLSNTDISLRADEVGRALEELETRLVVLNARPMGPTKYYTLCNDLLPAWIRTYQDMDRVIELIEFPEIPVGQIRPAGELHSLERTIKQRQERIIFLESRLIETQPEDKEAIQALSASLATERAKLDREMKQMKDLSAAVGVADGAISEPAERELPADVKPAVASLRQRIKEVRANLRLIDERKSEYVLGTDVPLQLIKEERRLHEDLATLESRLRQILTTATTPPERRPTSLSYEVGLRRLKERVWQIGDRDLMSEYSVLEARLLESLSADRLYGSSEEIRAERSRVIASLNRLALGHLNVSFNDLAMGDA